MSGNHRDVLVIKCFKRVLVDQNDFVSRKDAGSKSVDCLSELASSHSKCNVLVGTDLTCSAFSLVQGSC